ncbi:DNA/RNA nuclease SfsA [Bdellovibrio sp. ZAP7]|uniref:DNA/RNA nuclease SfsA n=1 Tax=Bdellovibrio sp. ZAP7 TaxID=2231053 RepID=UPI0011587ACF|nr:DNA/RNA nuclease SfsA [Bdellovibrio sp. ZAP7]QDK44634.1 DNA/RNA nuclease SfsA [Bdellovibrio sp. ZAP7]
MLIVPWTGKLVSGKLLQRRHRFLLDVLLDSGEKIVAHCINPGRMEGLVRPGARIWLSHAQSPKRNLKWVWELIEIEGTLICTNSWSANKIVKALLDAKAISGFKKYKTISEEVRLGTKTRIDFCVQQAKKSHFVEVKSVQQVCSGVGYFPNSTVLRSQSHLKALLRIINSGHRATLLAVVQRNDAELFRPSDLHDPVFAKALRIASRKGLVVRALLVEPTTKGFKFHGDLPVDLKPYETTELEEWRKDMKEFSGWVQTKGNPNAAWRKSNPKSSNQH